MTRDLITVEPGEKLATVKEIFDQHRIHHIPVVDEDDRLVGLISKTDFKHFIRGMQRSDYDTLLEQSRLNNYTAAEIMTRGLAKLEPQDRINVALEIFKENLFHAIPIVENGRLVGILTSFDIIHALAEEDNVLTGNG